MTRLGLGVLVLNLFVDPLRPVVFRILRERSHAQPSTFPSLPRHTPGAQLRHPGLFHLGHQPQLCGHPGLPYASEWADPEGMHSLVQEVQSELHLKGMGPQHCLGTLIDGEGLRGKGQGPYLTFHTQGQGAKIWARGLRLGTWGRPGPRLGKAVASSTICMTPTATHLSTSVCSGISKGGAFWLLHCTCWPSVCLLWENIHSES